MKNPSPGTATSRPSTTTRAPSPAAPATKPLTRSSASRVISGPMSLSGSVPSPTRSPAMRSDTFAMSGSATSPTATTTETAMQRSPADP